jgi:hypothetical protein
MAPGPAGHSRELQSRKSSMTKPEK